MFMLTFNFIAKTIVMFIHMNIMFYSFLTGYPLQRTGIFASVYIYQLLLDRYSVELG
jgi:hypothetical protein